MEIETDDPIGMEVMEDHRRHRMIQIVQTMTIRVIIAEGSFRQAYKEAESIKLNKRLAATQFHAWRVEVWDEIASASAIPEQGFPGFSR